MCQGGVGFTPKAFVSQDAVLAGTAAHGRCPNAWPRPPGRIFVPPPPIIQPKTHSWGWVNGGGSKVGGEKEGGFLGWDALPLVVPQPG